MQPGHSGSFVALQGSLSFAGAGFPSDCLPEVPLQVSDYGNVAGECPRYGRIRKGMAGCRTHDSVWPGQPTGLEPDGQALAHHSPP